MSLPPLSQDLVRREPVWQAWSGLYLDTEGSAALLEGDARTLAASAYSIEELRQILWDEVHPACIANLMVPSGGEWAFFSAEWLRERILRRATIRYRFPARWMLFRAGIAKRAGPMLEQVAIIRAAQ